VKICVLVFCTNFIRNDLCSDHIINATVSIFLETENPLPYSQQPVTKYYVTNTIQNMHITFSRYILILFSRLSLGSLGLYPFISLINKFLCYSFWSSLKIVRITLSGPISKSYVLLFLVQSQNHIYYTSWSNLKII
jgi:hypothetical protein